MSPKQSKPAFGQMALALGVLVWAGFLAFQASQLKVDAGYAGIGPAFMPWCLSVALGVCGLGLLLQALRQGFHHVETPAFAPYWPALLWLCAAIVWTALTLTTIGFVLACAMAYALAVRGLLLALGEAAPRLSQSVSHLLIGLILAWTVYLIFAQGLGVHLPGLTSTGWL